MKQHVAVQVASSKNSKVKVLREMECNESYSLLIWTKNLINKITL